MDKQEFENIIIHFVIGIGIMVLVNLLLLIIMFIKTGILT